MFGKLDLMREHAAEILGGMDADAAAMRLQPDFRNLPAPVPASGRIQARRLEAMWAALEAPAGCRETLLGGVSEEMPLYQGNIENAIGAVRVPVGVAGPLRVNGLSAKGDYKIPLATTEAALVASYHRGCCAITAAGGCSAIVLFESLSRAPAFVFASAGEACRFVIWVLEQTEHLTTLVAAGTSHGRLIDIGCTVEGNHVYLTFEYTTGDASGQNMVTLATERLCEWILQHSPQPPLRYYVEGNLSGDKKASAKAFIGARGRKVTAEVKLSREIVEKTLRTSAQAMVDYWQVSAIGGVLSGTIGVQGHFANGLAALYLATGQDVACVAESAAGVTRFEMLEDGGLYASVSLPGVMVGTVGGGTGLPTQRACLELMGLAGSGKARALAEVCGGLLLAGELSIIAALSAGHFARAHRKLARGRSGTLRNPDE